MKAVIIMPPWNERKNIPRLIKELLDLSDKTPYDIHILMVEDHASNGTADVIKASQRECPKIHLIQGKNKRWGNGMVHALAVLHADVVLETDADFSHNPADVPRLPQTLAEGYDFVIGSRYVSGGSIPQEWGLLLTTKSLFANSLSRHWAGLKTIHDGTAGFRAIRSTLLRKIALQDIEIQGYAF